MSIKEIAVILVLFFVIISGSWIAVYLLQKHIHNSEGISIALIGGIGNVLGGIIGGIVAYIVAAYQINHKLRNDDNKESAKVLSLLRLISSELNYNMKVLNNCKEDFSTGSHLSLLSTLSTDTWDKCSDRLGEKVSLKTIEKAISCAVQINAFKRLNNIIPVGETNQLIQSVSETINLIDNDMSSLSNN